MIEPERAIDEPPTEPWPPPYPPEPPMAVARSAAGASEPLTAVAWSISAAVRYVAATVVLTVMAGFAASAIAISDLEPAIFTIVLMGLLSGVYLLVVGIAWLAANAQNMALAPAFGIRRASIGTLLMGAFAATLVGRVAAGAWGLLVERLGLELVGKNIDPTELFPSDWMGIAATVIVAGVLAPVAEELVFRGVLLSAIDRRWGSRNAVLWSSVVFSLMHVSPYTIPPIFVLSLVFGWLFVRTRSLWVCIFAHSVFNVSGLVALYAMKGAGLL